MSIIQRIIVCMEKVLNKFSDIFAYFISLKYQITYQYGSKKWRSAFYDALNLNLFDNDENTNKEISYLLSNNKEKGCVKICISVPKKRRKRFRRNPRKK